MRRHFEKSTVTGALALALIVALTFRLAELRILEDELAQAERNRRAGERRIAELLSVEPDLGPRDGVEVHRAARLDVDRLHLARFDLDLSGRACSRAPCS